MSENQASYLCAVALGKFAGYFWARSTKKYSTPLSSDQKLTYNLFLALACDARTEILTPSCNQY